MDRRKLGRAKVVATKIGISVEQYLQNINSGLKWCFRCKNFLSRDFFCNAADKKDGKHSQCKKCERVSARSRYKPISAEEKESRNPGRRDGDKQQARNRVGYEIKKGKLPRAQAVPCNDCGHIGSDRQHEYDHYLGYDAINHLNVQCVCQSCHRQRERQRRKKQEEINGN